MSKKLRLFFGTVLFFLITSSAGYFYFQTKKAEAMPSNNKNKTNLPFKVNKDFKMSVYAYGIKGARIMTVDKKGNIIVSVPSKGNVIALVDSDNDKIVETKISVIENLNYPSGLAFDCENENNCKLYIVEKDRVVSYDYDQINLKALNGIELVDLPETGDNKFLPNIFLDDQKMLISVGSPCGNCNKEDWKFSKILIGEKDGNNLVTFAFGFKSPVFMKFHPYTKKLWVTDSNQKLTKEKFNLLPDEINVVEQGKNYGWPNCYGKNLAMISLQKSSCVVSSMSPSYINIPAQSEPQGLGFFSKKWSKKYRYNLLVAYHGSKVGKKLNGFKIVRYILDKKGKFKGKEDFVSGWIAQENKIIGRPADILFYKDAIFISDDKAGIIYRIIYSGQKK
jgi:glucose/arabinose dehydrogenase